MLCHTCRKWANCTELDRRKMEAAGKCDLYEDDKLERRGLLGGTDWVW